MKLISLLLHFNSFFIQYEINLSTENATFVLWIVSFMDQLYKPTWENYGKINW